MNIDPNEYDVTICELCKHWHCFNWLDPSTMKTEYDSECLKGHKHIAETECKDFERKIKRDLSKCHSDCWNYRTEYHEWDCQGTWTSENSCDIGHDIEDTDATMCQDYAYKNHMIL